jgi:predicted RNA-binding protein with PIN domain
MRFTMPYLIDGHNLIGQMPTIRLDDPDDEAKMVMVLQRFAMRRQVSVSVVFDRGHYGRQTLGGSGVNVRFARSPSDADAMIKSFLNHIARPADWVLVSSDREIVAVAEAVGARTISAHDFATTLVEMDAPRKFDSERAQAHAHVRPEQVDEWLDLFGVDAEAASQAVDLSRKKTDPPASAQRVPAPRQQRTQTHKPRPAIVRPEPPHRWEEPRRGKNPNPVPREADGRPRRSRGGPRPISSEGERLLKPPPPVHPDEIDEWLEFFGAEE